MKKTCTNDQQKIHFQELARELCVMEIHFITTFIHFLSSRIFDVKDTN